MASRSMGMTNAERQRRFRERRDAGEPVRTVVRPKDRRPRPAVGRRRRPAPHPCRPNTRPGATRLPESLAASRTAELLEGVCAVDLEALDVELPRGFGWD